MKLFGHAYICLVFAICVTSQVFASVDNRVPLTPKEYSEKYSFMGALTSIADPNSDIRGSGALIGHRRVFVTAAHNLLVRKNGKMVLPANALLATPDWSYIVIQFPICGDQVFQAKSVEFAASNIGRSKTVDWAIMTLDRAACAQAQPAEARELTAQTVPDLAQQSVQLLANYGRDQVQPSVKFPNGSSNWFFSSKGQVDSGYAVGEDSYILTSTGIFSIPGASGGPVLVKSQGRQVVIGIILGTANDKSYTMPLVSNFAERLESVIKIFSPQYQLSTIVAGSQLGQNP